MIDAAQSQSHPRYQDGERAFDMRSSVALACSGAPMTRAAENIARWNAYLPEECVKSMMNHGWHWSR